MNVILAESLLPRTCPWADNLHALTMCG